MMEAWRKYLAENLQRNLEMRAKMEDNLIECVSFYGFIELSLIRRQSTLGVELSDESLKSITNREREKAQPSDQVWLYIILISVKGENPETISCTENSVPASTPHGFYECYLEIVQIVRRLFWMPRDEIPTVLNDSFDTSNWINLNFVRDAILNWRFKNGQ